MRFLVVGCGRVGSEIVRDLSYSEGVDQVVAADAQRESLARLKGWPHVTTIRTSLEQPDRLERLINAADVVCGALPGKIGFRLMKAAVELGRDTVDISYTPEDPFALHRRALDEQCALVPQCGVAPGFTNMCVGDASRAFDRIIAVRIFVGGLPQHPVPPLNYRIVFSLDDVINVYTRPVRIIEDGRRKTVEPLSERGFLHFPEVGRLEYFLTDGLGTLSRSFPKVRNMQEMTLRYPGHAEMMNVLSTLGYFGLREVRVNERKVQPRQLSLELLKSAFNAGTPEDLLAFRVDVEGRAGGKRLLLRYQMLDHYDRKNQVSAMARTTAYPCTSVALMVARRKIPWKGIVTPERIAQDSELFGFILSRLKARGVILKIQRRPLPS